MEEQAPPLPPPLRLLRSLELRLLRCTIPSDSPPSTSSPPHHPTTISHLQPLIETLLQFIESGNYIQALSSDAAKSVFKFDGSEVQFADSAESAELFYSQLVPQCVDVFIVSETCDENSQLEQCFRGFLVMAIGVAAFLAFTQSNITGPVEKFPASPLVPVGDNWVEWEAWAIKDIMSFGSDVQGKFSNLQHLVFAKVLLMKTKDLLLHKSISTGAVRSISWWLLRLLLVHQKLLDSLSSSLFDLLQVSSRESLHHFGALANVKNYWGLELSEEDASSMVSVLHLEVGIMELIYARVDSSGLHFELAEKESGLDLSLSGALGFRTKHQVEPRPQLILVSHKSNNEASSSVSNGIQGKVSSSGNSTSHQHPSETLEASDVLMAPRFLDDGITETDGQSGEVLNIAATQLKAVQQAVVLAHCLAIKKAARSEEYQMYKLGPFIQAIDSQHSSHFMIRYFCDILRIQWEATRTRTIQRALLMMTKLVETLNEPSPTIAERMYLCFAVNSPTIPAVRKEYGDLLVSCGLIGEALKVYEDLELWDNLIVCYTMLEKKAAAVELIKTELSKRPKDPRLWCSLGDVTLDETCYQKALEVSDNKSARAFRSLARSAYNRGDYQKSMVFWDSAMKINSLYSNGWFALGFAAMKAGDFEKALDGFTRCVQLDPENGEAWNNLGYLHMRNKKSKEAFVAFKEALKFKRKSWQLWDNFSTVATDIGYYGRAIEAVQEVLDLTSVKRVDVGLLKRIMLEIENQAANLHLETEANIDGDDNMHDSANSDIDFVQKSTTSEEGVATKREYENLMHMFGKILRQIVQSNAEAEIWGLYARWHKLKGDLRMCAEALLKQTRAYQGSDLWKDRERFVKFAQASLELSKVYQELSRQTGSQRELYTTEMHIKNIIKQGASFSDTQEYQDLLASLAEVQKALQNDSAQ
ncbi:OLC1v1008082C1 [Oldenlandia corymbosa var. corymbosa]|uniref:OLC1v1008082C1 n=1 Tax=Oldenlandia corymbosa var. corymbosa TaxID=529605 RepID=A0AAV1DLA1_OLDCO|nr:OLC1v1008082C1 [Oldenlandia corymbosa var. corymbosa]